ncbi:hypothetical protein SNEBB_006582 [Seison nebaliae]|nr:hypothetical protein SNEBB_006582 [Seison nebaliae]
MVEETSFLPSKCGLTPFHSNATSRLVSSSNAEVGSWPWNVSIRKYGQHICGGTIIDEQYVLTAAHCVLNPDFELLYATALSVMIGSIDRTNPKTRITQVIGFYIHEKFNYESTIHDIAILKLGCKLPLERKESKIEGKIIPLCLPPVYLDFNKRNKCFVVGWGVTSPNVVPKILQEKSIELLDHSKCKNPSTKMDKYKLCSIAPSYLLSPLTTGDSGGALTCHHYGDRWFLAGITSLSAGKYSVFTKLSMYLGWIHNVIVYLEEDLPEFPSASNKFYYKKFHEKGREGWAPYFGVFKYEPGKKNKQKLIKQV